MCEEPPRLSSQSVIRDPDWSGVEILHTGTRKKGGGGVHHHGGSNQSQGGILQPSTHCGRTRNCSSWEAAMEGPITMLHSEAGYKMIHHKDT